MAQQQPVDVAGLTPQQKRSALFLAADSEGNVTWFDSSELMILGRSPTSNSKQFDASDVLEEYRNQTEPEKKDAEVVSKSVSEPFKAKEVVTTTEKEEELLELKPELD